MILDTLGNAFRYVHLNHRFPLALKFMRETNLAELSTGRHMIDGDRVYASVSRGAGRRKEDCLLEAHFDYIDIQVVLAGVEEMGWKSRSLCEQPAGEYDRKKDMQFFKDSPDTWFTVQPGQFVIFFPEDAHMPMIAPHEIHKVVIKVVI